MADIIEVIADDHRRIRLLREALHAAAAGQDGNPAAGDTLASAWDSLAGLIELHLRGQDEICLRPAAGIEPTHTDGRAVARGNSISPEPSNGITNLTV